MSTNTYDFDATAADPGHIRLEVTLLDGDGTVDFSPTLILRGLADTCALADLPGLYVDRQARALVREHIHSLEILEENSATTAFRVGLAPEWVEQLAGIDWSSTAYASDFPVALHAVANPKANKILIAWSAWPGGPGFGSLHTLGKRGLGPRKAVLNHPGITAIAGDARRWFTAGGAEVREWSSTGKLKKTHDIAGVQAATLTDDGLLLGLDDGRLMHLEGSLIAELDGPVTAVAAAGSHLVAGTASGQVWTQQGAVSLGAGPVEDVAVHGDGSWRAVHDGQVHHGHGGTCTASERDTETRSVSMYESAVAGTQASFIQRGSVCLVDLVDPVPRFLELPVTPVKSGCQGDQAWAGSRERLLAWRGDELVVDAEADFQLGIQPSVPPVFSPDGAWLAVFRQEAPVALFEMASGRCVELPLPSKAWGPPEVQGLAWLSADTLLASTNSRDVLRHDLGAPGWVPFEHPDGEIAPLVAAGLFTLKLDDRVRVFANGAVVADLQAGDDARPIAASASGVLVTDHWSAKEGRLWRDGASVAVFARVDEAALSPDGHWLALHEYGATTLQLWDTRSAEQVASFEVKPRLLVVDDEGVIRCEAAGAIHCFRHEAEPLVWVPDPQEVSFAYRGVGARGDGWVCGSERQQEARLSVLPDGRVARLGKRVHVGR